MRCFFVMVGIVFRTPKWVSQEIVHRPRKASANYQSQGLSINLTAELDQSLLADPPRLQLEIDRIYAQAEQALDRQGQAVTTMTGMTASEQQVPHAGDHAAPNRAPHRNGRDPGFVAARHWLGGGVRYSGWKSSKRLTGGSDTRSRVPGHRGSVGFLVGVTECCARTVSCVGGGWR
jgi:hypothetical protein